MTVNNKINPGFQEVIYLRCLTIELERAGLSLREQEQTVYYDGIEVGTRRANFVVENQVVVERFCILGRRAIKLLSDERSRYPSNNA